MNPYCKVWDPENQTYAPINIDADGCLWGFPDSGRDGTHVSQMAFPKHVIWVQQVHKGDRIRIDCPLLPYPVTGIAESVDFSSYDGQYAIEMIGDDGQFRYWKQWADGGTVEKIDCPPPG